MPVIESRNAYFPSSDEGEKKKPTKKALPQLGIPRVNPWNHHETSLEVSMVFNFAV